jgi:hypothetical protein
MTERLEGLLRACTIRVVGGAAPGTGFFVAPGKVVTCVHVIGVEDHPGLRVIWERDGLEPVEFPLTGRPLRLAHQSQGMTALDEFPDIAILDIARVNSQPCVRVDLDWPVHGDRMQAFGYHGEGAPVPMTPAVLAYRGPHGIAPQCYLDLASDTVKPGMSGSAVLNSRTGGVCGVIVATRDPVHAVHALAVPWSAIASDASDVLAANRAFHDQDRRWAAAARPPSSTAPKPERTTAPSTEVIIEVTDVGTGVLDSCVRVAGNVLCYQKAALPTEVTDVWKALDLPPLYAGERMVDAGRRLGRALLDDSGQRMLARRLNEIPPGGAAEVVLVADEPWLALPLELMRLATDGGEVGPLGLMPNVSVIRRMAAPGTGQDRQPGPLSAPEPIPGPLKILAAVAAPDETKTRNAPLDVEAEMAAVLNATSEVAAGSHAQVRILEVASLRAIREALAADTYHVLHLSAHGSSKLVELEDEDGAPATVTSEDLVKALRSSGRPVPLIVLSACSAAIAPGLVARGADRVIAMLAPITDTYATMLARYLYRELAVYPDKSVGQALARARYQAEDERFQLARDQIPRPEYGAATLFTANGDAPLVDQTAKPIPLTVATAPPAGKGARELPVGALIGRRAQLRGVIDILRRADRAVERFGVASGVVLTGVGGIGKSALAGRVMSRLRDDGWLIAVHEGRWNPTVLISSTARAIGDAIPRADDQAVAGALGRCCELLGSGEIDDSRKLAIIADLLSSLPILMIFDDFEQNLTTGGGEFLDPATDEAITRLADAAETGALLLTCRYPLPGPDRLLVPVPVPPLSAAELRRLFLRLPALRELDMDDRRLLMRTIGGHPRLIEFTDALLRGGHANLRHVQVKLRELARRQGVNAVEDVPVQTAIDQAMLLGSADILLDDLIQLLTPRQVDLLRQVAVCRGPMTLDDLAFTITNDDSADSGPQVTGQCSDVGRVTDLTLLVPGENIEMHPWTAALVIRNTERDTASLHERALAMRSRRFEQRRGTYDDLIDIPGHLAALGRYDEAAAVASQARRVPVGTLATVAYLAEILSLIPASERAWAVVGELEALALLQAGDLQSAARQLQVIYKQIKARAVADPANTEWQRDLSSSHNKLGDIGIASGDITTAHAHCQAALDIAARLAAADRPRHQPRRARRLAYSPRCSTTTASSSPPPRPGTKPCPTLTTSRS